MDDWEIKKPLGQCSGTGKVIESGEEYFAAMNLMGKYAAANHAVIHRRITKAIGAKVLTGVAAGVSHSWHCRTNSELPRMPVW